MGSGFKILRCSHLSEIYGSTPPPWGLIQQIVQYLYCIFFYIRASHFGAEAEGSYILMTDGVEVTLEQLQIRGADYYSSSCVSSKKKTIINKIETFLIDSQPVECS